MPIADIIGFFTWKAVTLRANPIDCIQQALPQSVTQRASSMPARPTYRTWPCSARPPIVARGEPTNLETMNAHLIHKG
jgi:hypothetical protein